MKSVTMTQMQARTLRTLLRLNRFIVFKERLRGFSAAAMYNPDVWAHTEALINVDDFMSGLIAGIDAAIQINGGQHVSFEASPEALGWLKTVAQRHYVDETMPPGEPEVRAQVLACAARDIEGIRLAIQMASDPMPVQGFQMAQPKVRQ